MRVQVLGNVVGPIFVYYDEPHLGLDDLGVRACPSSASACGRRSRNGALMLNTLRTAIYVNPLVAALPGLAIFIVSISFNLFSDGLRNAMEIRSERHPERT